MLSIHTMGNSQITSIANNKKDMHTLMNAAYYMKIESLLYLACATFAWVISRDFDMKNIWNDPFYKENVMIETVGRIIMAFIQKHHLITRLSYDSDTFVLENYLHCSLNSFIYFPSGKNN